MTDDEKKAMMEGMDKAAEVAEKEFKAMSQHLTVPMARWWLKHYGKAGHKRLGRIMVQHAKTMEKTTPNQWADADVETDVKAD
jgi:hypothetical protein